MKLRKIARMPVTFAVQVIWANFALSHKFHTGEWPTEPEWIKH